MKERTWAALFCGAVALQLVILGVVPARKIWARATGETVELALGPVDPYDVLSGWYMTLAYEAGRTAAYPEAPSLSQGDECFAVLRRDAQGISRPVSLHAEHPGQQPEGLVVLRGRVRSRGRIAFGAEAFFMPEEDRFEIQRDVREHREQVRGELKVDASGRAALVRLLVADRAYE